MDNLTTEIWKPVKDYEGLYEVSTHGNVKGLIKGRILNPRLNRDGYAYINLYRCNKQKSINVHRLVACAFIPKIDGKHIINHINEVRHDNRVENLEWCTQSDNVLAFWNKRKGKRSNIELTPVVIKRINQPLYSKLSNHNKFNSDYLDHLLTFLPIGTWSLEYKRRNPIDTKETIKLMMDHGYKIQNGIIVNSNNTPVNINHKGMIFKKVKGNNYHVLAKFFVWYWFNHEIPYDITFKDGNSRNFSLHNLVRKEIKLYRRVKDSEKYRVEINLGGSSYCFGSYINETEAKKASAYLLSKLQKESAPL